MKHLNNMKEVPVSHRKWIVLTVAAFTFTLSFITQAMAQQERHMYRLAKIQVDSSQLNKYNMALKEQMTTAIRVEPGVLSYYAVADSKDPSHITIFEIYADSAAYKTHIESPHFKKYKQTVQNMVTSLEVIDVNLIGSAKKPGM